MKSENLFVNISFCQNSFTFPVLNVILAAQYRRFGGIFPLKTEKLAIFYPWHIFGGYQLIVCYLKHSDRFFP